MKNKLASTVCVLVCALFALSAAAGCARQNVSSEAAVSSRTATAAFGQYAVPADSEEIIELYHQYFDLTDEMKAEFAEHGYTEAQIADMDRVDYEQISLYWTNTAAAQTSLMPDSQRLQWLEEQGIDTGDESHRPRPGFWAHISDDNGYCTEHYPMGKVIEDGKIVQLLRKYDNLYCDISAGSGANALKRDPEFTRRFLTEFSDRILYGRDYFDNVHQQVLDSLGLEQEVLDKIYFKNALRLVPLE